MAHTEIKRKIKEVIKSSEENVVFCEIPLLIEANMVDFFDEVWCVNCEYSVKIKRLMERDNIDLISAENMIKCQTNDKKLLQIATRIIDNNGSLEQLFEKVKSSFNAIM